MFLICFDGNQSGKGIVAQMTNGNPYLLAKICRAFVYDWDWVNLPKIGTLSNSEQINKMCKGR